MAKRFLSLSASDIASFKSVELTDLPTGPADRVLTGQLEWQQVDPATMLKPPSSGLGRDKIVVAKPFAVPPDYETQYSIQWTDDIDADRVYAQELHAAGTLHANSSTGTSGQVLSSTGTGVQWIDPPSADIEPGPANSVLVTDPDGDQTEWSDKLEIETLKVNGDMGIDGELIVFGDAGTEGQVLRKTLTGPEWQTLPALDLSDIPAGTEGQVLTTAGNEATWQSLPPLALADIPTGTSRQLLQTNTAGTAAQWTSSVSLSGSVVCSGGTIASGTTTFSGTSVNFTGTTTTINTNLRFNNLSGTAGQYLRKTGSTTQAWSDLEVDVGDLTGGSANQILTTIGGTPQWRSTASLSSLTLSGASTALNFYFYSSYSRSWRRDGTTTAPVDTVIQAVRVGRVVTLHFPAFVVNRVNPTTSETIGYMGLSTNLIARLRPVTETVSKCLTTNGGPGAGTDQDCLCVVGTDGSVRLRLYYFIDAPYSISAGGIYFHGFTVSYVSVASVA